MAKLNENGPIFQNTLHHMKKVVYKWIDIGLKIKKLEEDDSLLMLNPTTIDNNMLSKIDLNKTPVPEAIALKIINNENVICGILTPPTYHLGVIESYNYTYNNNGIPIINNLIVRKL